LSQRLGLHVHGDERTGTVARPTVPMAWSAVVLELKSTAA
jgi:hypothetical protein